jgi:hypothetical protein
MDSTKPHTCWAEIPHIFTVISQRERAYQMLPYFAQTATRQILSALATVDTSTSQLKVSFTEPVASAFLAKLEFSSLSAEPLRLAVGHMQLLGETLLEELDHHLKEKGYFKVRSDCSINSATRQIKFDITLNLGL